MPVDDYSKEPVDGYMFTCKDSDHNTVDEFTADTESTSRAIDRVRRAFDNTDSGNGMVYIYPVWRRGGRLVLGLSPRERWPISEYRIMADVAEFE